MSLQISTRMISLSPGRTAAGYRAEATSARLVNAAEERLIPARCAV
ncbi:hypothetical protein [Streptomyces sp. NPDC051310]